MTITRLTSYGIGIKTTTYFKLVYVIYSGEAKYYLLHTAVFGVN